MKNKPIKLLALLFLFFTTQAYSNPIDKINLIGLNNSSESTLLMLIPFKIGQNFSPYASEKIIESLFETGLFQNISIMKNKNTLNITLKENPSIKFLEITSSKDSGWSDWLNTSENLFSSDALQEIAIMQNISAGNIFTDKKLSEFINVIESEYNKSGFYNATVEVSTDLDVQNRIGIDVLIDQGNRAKIESLTISGNSKFSEKELLKLFTIGEPGLSIINYFTKKDSYTEPAFKKGVDSITNLYFDSGYLDFKFLSVDTNLSDSNEEIFIEIKVSEGIQYKLGNVSFEGDLESINKDELLNIITMGKGDVFNRNSIITDIQKLTDLFADKGYAFVDINPVTKDILDSVNLNFIISLNKKVYINRIAIQGNTRTVDEVIRREIEISEGGLYSRSALRDSLIKLRRLGYFSDVQISTSEVIGSPDKIDIVFNVEETKTGSVSFSVSHSNNFGISIGAGIQEKNIFGSGNTLNANLKVSESFNQISFYFMNPNYNDENHSVSVGAFKSEIKDNDVMKDSYEISTTGINFGYGIPLTKGTRINTSIEYASNKIKCGASFSASSYESSQCAISKNDELKVGAKWSENTLDNFQYPTDGESNSLNISTTLPLGDYRYFSINASHESYEPINTNLTLKLKGNFDLSKGYSGKQLPFFKRYFGGGSGSVRGFGNKSLGPIYPNGNAKGGELSMLGSANLIAPAFFFSDNEKMRMSAFIDAGNIFEKSSNIKLGDLRMSTGFGFAYLSPIGAIGAYWSTPILKKSGDIIETFGFTLGSGF